MTSVADDPSSSTATLEISNIISTKHKRRQAAKICFLALLTILSIVVLIADVVVTTKTVEQQEKLKEYVETSLKVSAVINALQDERSITAFHLASMSSGGKMTRQSQPKLQIVRNITDASIQDLRSEWQFTLFGKNKLAISDFSTFVDEIHRLRSEINQETNDSRLRHYFAVHTDWIKVFILWMLKSTNFDDSTTDHEDLHTTIELAAYYMIVKSKEESEMEKAFGALYFHYGVNFTFQNISLYHEKRVRAKAFLETAQLLSLAVKSSYLSIKNEVNTSSWLHNLEKKRENLTSNTLVHSSWIDAVEWFDLTTNYSDFLVRLEVNEAHRITSHVDEIASQGKIWLILRSLLTCLVLVLAPVFIISLVRVQKELYKYAYTLHHKVGLEQSRTEFLLRENSRHMEGLVGRWKQFSMQANPENRVCQIQRGVSEK